MTSVRAVMTPDPTTASMDSPVVDVAKAMEADAIGAVVVCDATGSPMGVVTDRDLAVEVIAAGRDPATTAVGDLLVGQAVVTARVDDDLASAVKVMKEQAVRRLPVLDGDRVVGMLSQADIARRDPALAAELVEVVSSAHDNTARG